MNGTINIIPGVVAEETQKLSVEIEKFKDLCNKYMQTKHKLDSWNSSNKVALERIIDESKPAFDEAVEVVTSYKDVAIKSVALVSEAEREIREKLMA